VTYADESGLVRPTPEAGRAGTLVPGRQQGGTGRIVVDPAGTLPVTAGAGQVPGTLPLGPTPVGEPDTERHPRDANFPLKEGLFNLELSRARPSAIPFDPIA
jgi:hypothetical protein